MGYGRVVLLVMLLSAIAALSLPQLGLAQDSVLDEFRDCSVWYQELDQPGATLVACDQAQLDRFIASGLTDGGKGGAQFDGPERRVNEVPSVYSTEDPRG